MEKTVHKQYEEQTDSYKEVNQDDEDNKNHTSDSWSKLKDRYINVWRGRASQEGYLTGIRNSILSGLLCAGLLFVVTSSTPVIGGIMYFYMGSTIGAGVSGYRNKLDFFGGFHIGLLTSGLLMMVSFISSFIASPSMSVAFLPLLLFYVLTFSFSHGIYALIGKEARDDVKESNLNI